MSITDELRKWAEDNTLQDRVLTTYPPQHAVHGVLETLLRIADRIDAEHEASCAEAYGNGVESVALPDMTAYVKLPMDADGEYIHIGDVMVYADGNTCPLPVVALVPPAVFLTEEGPRYADMCRHAPDTWERIIRDAIGEGMARELSNHNGGYDRSDSLSNASLVARCKALAGEE